jgi:hypothetical protein
MKFNPIKQKAYKVVRIRPTDGEYVSHMWQEFSQQHTIVLVFSTTGPLSLLQALLLVQA